MTLIWSFYLRVEVEYGPPWDLLNHKHYCLETLQAITPKYYDNFWAKKIDKFFFADVICLIAFHSFFAFCYLFYQV